LKPREFTGEKGKISGMGFSKLGREEGNLQGGNTSKRGKQKLVERRKAAGS